MSKEEKIKIKINKLFQKIDWRFFLWLKRVCKCFLKLNEKFSKIYWCFWKNNFEKIALLIFYF